jgi:DNA-binding SARP family transcriptional activator
MLYAVMGSRDQAVRQFQMCREVLQRDLGVLPAESTLALYEEILADRTPKRIDAPAGDPGVVESHRGGRRTSTGHAMIGRDWSHSTPWTTEERPGVHFL